MKDVVIRFTRPAAIVAAMIAAGADLGCGGEDSFERKTESVMTTSSIRYRIIDVGSVRDAGNMAVNDSGTVVTGNRSADDAARKVFAFDAGIRTPLKFGQGDEYVVSINDKGWAIGWAQSSGLVVYRDGKADSFPELLSLESIGRDINSNGDVVGGDGPGFAFEAILFRDGGITRLGTLGGPGSNAFALNEHAQVVGVADTSDTWGGRPVRHAFLYESGVMKDLGTLGGVSSGAHDINDAGHIVGEAKVPGVDVGEEDPLEYNHAFVYADGVMKDLGVLPGDSFSSAQGISEDDTIVGYSNSIARRTAHAFVYRDGVMTDLNELIDPSPGWELVIAYSISKSGLIAGIGSLNGEEHAFLLVPETTGGGTGGGNIGFVSRRDGNRELYESSSDGTNVTRITSLGASDDAPASTPDGRSYVFVSNRDGNDELYRGDLGTDPGEAARLTNDPAQDRAPFVTPDGEHVLFSSTRSGREDIYRARLDGSDLVRLTSSPAADRSPTMSPDGSTLAFTSDRDGRFALYLMNADGTNVRRLNDYVGEGQADFSPDGTMLTFVSRRDRNREIYRVNVGGSDLRRLTFNTTDDLSPHFSPDGSKIAFATAREGGVDVWVMDAAGTNPHRVTSGENNEKPTWRPVVSR